MRLVNGGAPGASLAEHWQAVRDNPRIAAPLLPSEVKGFADIREPMPPSKAHIKRLRRSHEPAPVLRPPCERQALPGSVQWFREALKALPAQPEPPTPEPCDLDKIARVWRATDNHKPWRAGE